MQKKLSQWATDDPTKRFVDLYSLLHNPVWLRAAHHSVNTNQGRETAGIDGESMSSFNRDVEGNLERLREELKAKSFEPQPVQRVYIPKANGKTRPLGIPAIRDRIVQEALRMALEPIWEADFSVHSYGFRPNRSTYDAITYIGHQLNGRGATYQWIIEGDMTSYFDTIPQRRLIKAIKKRVADKDIRALLWKFLRAGVMEQGHYKETLTGTPQGGIISPLLANIYLHQLDVYMESTYLRFSPKKRELRRKRGLSNFLYTRYADDWIVLCNGTKEQAILMKQELQQVLENMGLKLSEEKTKITHITEGFTFLGYRIIREMGTRKMITKVEIPEKAINTFRHKIRGILAPGTSNDAVNAKILALNQVVRGWCNYYRSTNAPSEIFGKLSNEIYWDMAHWLGKKYKISIPNVMRRYWKDSAYRTKSKTLVMPSEYKAKKHLARTWRNPYTEKEAIKREKHFSHENLWLGSENRNEWGDIREEVILLKGTACYVCGTTLHPSEVEIDHKTPRKRFKDTIEADQVKNLSVICTECHRAKTKSDRKVLSRMR